MNGRNAPLSPVSLGDSDWPSPGYPTDKADPYAKNRGQLVSPPHSGGSIPGSMNGASFPSGPSGGPSPPPSIGRSSNGTNPYARSESGRSQREEATEAILADHYASLKRFLSQTSRDGKPAAPANKARDKLQRLTSVQFLELSTDVFDELVRRQAFARRPRNLPQGAGPPAYLLPEESFHPKRNQARQKLASLGPPRFRDLATDVFCELERRYPSFAAIDIPRMTSPASMRGPPSRSQTPVNGMGGFPPRGQSRRRPSEAGSVRSMRSGMGPPMPGGNNSSVPPSPGFAPSNYDRLLQKQAQTNTIVPNKSTMVEEDEDAIISPLSVGANSNNANNEAEKNAMKFEHEKRVKEYESQIKQLQEKMETMEKDMKQKQEELDAERTRSATASTEKQEWTDTRRDLETRLADTHDRGESLQQEIDRMRNDHAAEARQLRSQIEELRQPQEESSRSLSSNAANEDLTRENDELRQSLQEQQQVTDEVRREAEQFLSEMRALSEHSASTWEKHADMEKTIERLEAEVKDWRNRYARTKTQLRNMRATSMGLTIENNAGRYVQEKGFTTDTGLVKDVHVTKFQIAIDELLRRARVDEPEKAIESMKAVVVSVRQITKDIDDSAPQNEEVAQLQARLKTRVSATANNLITAAKNFAMSAGLSPVSLLDAAASHLVAAIVELLRTVKIRATPAGELEDDDDGTMTPVDTSASFFSPRSNGGQTTGSTTVSTSTTQSSLPPPPVFQGLGSIRDSADSSAYSPISSPRESVDRYGANGRRPVSRGVPANGGYLGLNKSLSSGQNDYDLNGRVDRRTEDLKVFLDDQTTTLVTTIQTMVGSIRSDAPVEQITGEINEIADIVGKVIAETEASGNGGQTLDKLVSCRQRLVEAGDRGEAMNSEPNGMRKQDWRTWTTSLPPIAFEIARETKELVNRVDRLVLGDSAEEFA